MNFKQGPCNQSEESVLTDIWYRKSGDVYKPSTFVIPQKCKNQSMLYNLKVKFNTFTTHVSRIPRLQ
jgi:hypothetical protein